MRTAKDVSKTTEGESIVGLLAARDFKNRV